MLGMQRLLPAEVEIPIWCCRAGLPAVHAVLLQSDGRFQLVRSGMPSSPSATVIDRYRIDVVHGLHTRRQRS